MSSKSFGQIQPKNFMSLSAAILIVSDLETGPIDVIGMEWEPPVNVINGK
ncbi:MAG: hypothetical protein Q8M40_03150 [Legionella sp.]|nr:hypothetical protein [Legionella sp.]